MHLISFDASPRQLSKLRNGHAVRIKKGSGFNLIVHPENYKLVSRAFGKNKGVEIKLTPEEIEHNKGLSPEEQQELGMEGGSIFSKIKRGIKKIGKSKEFKAVHKALKPALRELKKAGKEYAHEKIAEAHMKGAEHLAHHAPENEHLHKALSNLANAGHQSVHGVGVVERIARRARKMAGLGLLSDSKRIARRAIGKARSLTGLGLYAYPEHGRGINAHQALKMANLSSAHANHELAKLHNATIHGQLTQPPIKRYWNEPLAPPSRGTGLSHMHLIRGRGSLIAQDSLLPPALQSQPYGANWHMQFMLPPEYKRYNDGGVVEGRGLMV